VTSGSAFESDAVFAEIAARAKGDGGQLAKKINATYRFNVTKAGGDKKSWFIDATSSPVFVGQREGKADCEITLAEDILLKLQTNKLKADQAFMQGKLKLKGNMSKAMKLKDLIGAKAHAKL